jgi:N-acetylglucosamine-6-sulfatase
LQYHYRNYARVVVSLDRQIGRVLETLERLQLAENTVVIYASDNGYFWGEHRLVDKRWAYEESIRIPLIVRDPRRVSDPGRRAGQMILNIDVAPTILQLAGISVPETVEGQSFLPVLESASAIGRESWLYEYFKDFPYNVPSIRAVRTTEHIYINYGGRKNPELFDVINDPRQLNNLMNTPGGKRLLPNLQQKLENLQKADKPQFHLQ